VDSLITESYNGRRSQVANRVLSFCRPFFGSFFFRCSLCRKDYCWACHFPPEFCRLFLLSCFLRFLFFFFSELLWTMRNTPGLLTGTVPVNIRGSVFRLRSCMPTQSISLGSHRMFQKPPTVSKLFFAPVGEVLFKSRYIRTYLVFILACPLFCRLVFKHRQLDTLGCGFPIRKVECFIPRIIPNAGFLFVEYLDSYGW